MRLQKIKIKQNLQRLTAKLADVEKDNPIQNACSDQDLGECFADFFVDKIIKIWNEHDLYALCEPCPRALITTFIMLHPVTDDMAKKLVRSMQLNHVNQT